MTRHCIRVGERKTWLPNLLCILSVLKKQTTRCIISGIYRSLYSNSLWYNIIYICSNCTTIIIILVLYDSKMKAVASQYGASMSSSPIYIKGLAFVDISSLQELEYFVHVNTRSLLISSDCIILHEFVECSSLLNTIF